MLLQLKKITACSNGKEHPKYYETNQQQLLKEEF